MARKMLQFTMLDQKMPDKRLAEARARDFGEIYQDFTPERAEEQSSRCEQCGIPFCQIHCPLGNHIPDWLMLAAAGRLEEAYALSSATNNFPEICGRICPQDRLCEGNCVLEQSDHGAITIGSVEKYITETAFQQGWVKPVVPLREREHSIGIIGAGPAGLAAAEELRKNGYQVHVYDRHDRVGGLMIYGIPNFKLDKNVVERRTRLLQESGVRFHLNFMVGREASLTELKNRHDAVLIATGVYKARSLDCLGGSDPKVIPALSYLIAANRNGLGDVVSEFADGTLDAKDKNVVVIGGGDTGMDCLRTAIRQGAKSVTCLYRRDRANMPGSQREVTHAEEEGVKFLWLSAPEAILTHNGTISGIRAHRIHLSTPDATGRQTPVPIKDSSFTLKADMVIAALGFDPEDIPLLFDEPALTVSHRGTIRINHKTQMTSLEGVFAAGDIVRGASLVVWAIRDGREAAAAIHTYLDGKIARHDKTAMVNINAI